MSEGKSVFIVKQKRTGLDGDWFRFIDAAARSGETCKKI